MGHDLDGHAIELVSERDRTVVQLRFLELKRDTRPLSVSFRPLYPTVFPG